MNVCSAQKDANHAQTVLYVKFVKQDFGEVRVIFRVVLIAKIIYALKMKGTVGKVVRMGIMDTHVQKVAQLDVKLVKSEMNALYVRQEDMELCVNNSVVNIVSDTIVSETMEPVYMVVLLATQEICAKKVSSVN